MIQTFLGRMQDKLLWRLFSENFRQQWPWYAIGMIFMLGVAGATAASAWIMNSIVKSLTPGTPKEEVYMVALSVALIFTARGVATYLQSVFMAKAGNSVVASQQRKMYHRMLRQGMSFYSTQGSGDIMVSFTQAAQSARNVIDTIVSALVRDLFTLFGLLWVMFSQQPMLSSISILAIPFAILAMQRLLKAVRDIVTRELASISKIIEILTETTIGIRVVKAFSLEDRMMVIMDDAIRRVERMSNRIASLQAATMPLMDFLSGFAIAGILALSASTLFGVQIVTSQGQLMSFLTALIMAYEPARRIAQMRVQLETGMVGVKMMYTLLDAPITMDEKADARHLPSGPGEITFEGVNFFYSQDDPVLRDLNLTFPAGKTTALVGPSGGGKTTLVNLMMRLYDPTSGRICIDGHDISEVTFASLREKIAFVGQETFLFNGTVFENISLGRKDATEEDVIAAAKDANAHDFIMRMPQGYQSSVGENGRNLSGGQRQRLSIARAILRDAPILLLDEATSALDAESEHAIQQALIRLGEGRTTIMIAHRLSSVLRADEVIVIQSGEAVDRGSPKELVARENFFKKAYDLQTEAL
ncbi:ABC transporter ATP-binding protein [Acidimangrovimonas sediminis]|uniref:ABC transporter ATP-binding protein n=1 Tax=Acidimangrovimonas sediminis TaxID=2056283 RepID=UPI000C804B7A|nr:ABC transporter ATP-binding protein [Acidimangrovimonas sediminis]